MTADGKRLREAVEAVVATGKVLTRDLGGTSGTADAADAVAAALGLV
ncbi:MAG: 3-isopropylmalate dehydrogenase [Loktanella salsilacus]|jgi:3-isopropylmalate dehydrogenase